MKLTEQQVLALKRKRGEKNLSIGALAKSVGLSRWTISRIIKKNPNLSSTTVEKIKDWLIDQYTTIK
ncbi:MULTISPECIES: helix-turn-helix domain-containing protein [Lactobacillus]|uniref:helix-turn-helix domain-containing protein n=1 Tax=Lactobacillus TaxID=1578 RepID=UPI0022698DD2|nr:MULTISPECIES: helix-turn-helix transcriptional regulator [Lactobacillus]MCX8720797.1 helix-turn-helix transcriptional regulator [Lactobacillus sp. B4010]MCX8733003.1 helix-turn-helix transcriptional regulator [Lactobacillus sp. B4015]MCX8735559.1 helix-turn-helix transcriptional regulator [Lactobacillus sp. B4012]